MACSTGATALHLAAEHGYVEIVNYLLEQKADIDLVTNDTCSKGTNKTPIMLAIDQKRWEVVLLLLDAGSDFVKLVDYLFLNDDLNAFKWLMTTKPERFTQVYKNTLLLKAAAQNKPNIFSHLLTQQANVTQKDNDGYLSIHLTAMNNIESVKKIIEKDSAQANAPYINPLATHPDHGKTALFFAHEKNQADTVNFLLTQMTDATLFDSLALALQQNELGLATNIIDFKPALLIRRNADNKTALKIAVETGKQEAIDLCFKKNVFEETDPKVFRDIETFDTMNKRIAKLNQKLQDNLVQDVALMLDTQDLLAKVNGIDSPQSKIDEVTQYNAKHHTISDAKYALCIAALVGIAVGCVLAGALVSAFTFGTGTIIFGALAGMALGASIDAIHYIYRRTTFSLRLSANVRPKKRLKK